MKKFILASASARRKEILNKAGYDFQVIASDYDEKISDLKFSCALVENCALQKALDVQKHGYNDGIIIAADTVVVLEGQILGKPKDKNDALSMLKNLSNKKHFVATSICLIKNDKIVKGTDITHVTFRKLSDDEIINYINTKNPLDKAGSYGIQDNGFDFAISLSGEIDNVIGFPLKLFKKLLEEIENITC